MHLPDKKSMREKWGPYLVAFLVPVLVMIIVFLERQLYPLGDRCFLRTDLYHQYAPFFKELRNKLVSGGSLFYSFNIGGGTNFWTLAAYYLASPMNIFLLLCPEGAVIEFTTFFIVLKIALCSVTMTYFLNKKHEAEGDTRYDSVIFGLFYALSGYMAAYSWNIMWLDCLWLLPLIMLGLEKLVRESKGLLYGVSLGFCLFSNYYIGVMVCFGIAVYCFFLLATEREMLHNFGIKLLKFIGYTMLAILFSAVFLLPYLAYFKMTASSTGTFTWQWYSYFSVFETLARQLINVEVETGLNHWPNIYAGVFIFLLMPLYFLDRKITLREKIAYAVLFIFFFFSMTTRAMDYIWHVFHIPNSLPVRYGFLYVFFLLIPCYRTFVHLREHSYKDIGLSLVVSLAFVFAVEFLIDDEKMFPRYVIYISAVFLVIWTIYFYGVRKNRIYRDILITIGIALAALETCVNTSVTSVSTVSRSEYVAMDEGISSVMTRIREEEGENTFYRVEKSIFRTKNDGAWDNFPSISTFSSCANSHLTTFYKALGMEASTNAYGSYGQTLFTNMLLGVKYTISSKPLSLKTSLYDYYGGNNDNVWFYKNTYTLPLGYALSSDVLDSWILNSTDPIRTQNQFAELVSGVSDLFEDVTPSYVTGSLINFTIPADGIYYAYPSQAGPKEIQVTHDDFSRKFSNLNRSYLMELNYCKEGESVTFKNVESSSDKSISFSLYRINEDRMKEVYNAFSKNPLILDTFEDTFIEGHITMSEDGTLFTTLAGEDGWEVFVDGEKVSWDMAKKAYISVPLTKGEHQITFRFHVPYFVLGLILTLLSLGGFITIGILARRKEKRALALLQKIESSDEENPEGTKDED